MSGWTPAKDKTTNCSAYNDSLKRCRWPSIWFDPEMVWMPPPSGTRGRQQRFSDAAIQTRLTLKVLFGMPLRQTTGFVQSLLRLIGLDWWVAGRQHALPPPENPERAPALSWRHLLIDSTGIKAEWNARKHGGPKRRIWRKIHIRIDEETLEVRAIEVTTSNVGDAPILPELLSQSPADQTIRSVTADGAYDTRRCPNADAMT